MTTKKNEVKKTEFDFTTIKTFDDACKKENINPKALPDVSMIPEDLRKALIAAYKLFVIFKAINNGWKPNWNDSNEYKYYPWFKIVGGFGFSGSDYGYDCTLTAVSSRLCTDSSEKAMYIGKQFEQEYKDLFLIIE